MLPRLVGSACVCDHQKLLAKRPCFIDRACDTGAMSHYPQTTSAVLPSYPLSGNNIVPFPSKAPSPADAAAGAEAEHLAAAHANKKRKKKKAAEVTATQAHVCNRKLGT